MTGQHADTAGRAVLETIRGYGVDAVFGIPGTHSLELYRPLAQLGMRAITNRHEQGSGYGADGWARFSEQQPQVGQRRVPGADQTRLPRLAHAARQRRGPGGRVRPRR